MNRDKNTCPECKNKLKRIIKSHQIKTRDERRKIVNIENLPILECTVCPYTTLPESSEEIIQVVKNMVKVEMERLAKDEINTIKEKQAHPFASILKRFIS